MQTILKYNNVITCVNIIAIVECLKASSRINYVYMALSQNKFTLPNLHIAIDLSKHKKILYSLCKGKKSMS